MLDRVELVVDVVKVLAGISLAIVGVLFVWHFAFASDLLSCSFNLDIVECNGGNFAGTSGSATFYYGHSTSSSQPADYTGYSYDGVGAGISSSADPKPPVSGDTHMSTLPSCASVRWVVGAWSGSGVAISTPVHTPSGVCSGVVDHDLPLSIDATNFPPERGGITYTGTFASSGTSTLQVGEHVLLAGVEVARLVATGDDDLGLLTYSFAISQSELDGATGTFATSDLLRNIDWPGGVYVVSVHEVTTQRIGSATDTVVVVPHAPTTSSGGGGGSWGDDGIPTALRPQLHSFSDCITSLNATTFGCLIGTALYNVQQVPPFSTVSGIPVNMAYVMGASTSTFQLYFDAPHVAGDDGLNERLWIYDSTSSTRGFMGSAPPAFWATINERERQSYYLLTLISLICAAVYLLKHL